MGFGGSILISLRKAATRLYSDYLMPSRLAEYEKLVVAIKEAGYEQMSVRDAWYSLNKNKKLNNVFVHRHDIDTDLPTAKKFFEIELKHGVVSTFYFRQSTLDVKFMQDIEDCGGEASYHYEELATYAKKNHIKSPEVLLRHWRPIQENFRKNLIEIRDKTGLPCSTVASHGDFANRKLGLVNHLILQDPEFRKKCGVLLESYDEELIKIFDYRISDKPFPKLWHPNSPLDAIKMKASNIFLLTHPRQWQKSYVANTRENFVRLYEELIW